MAVDPAHKIRWFARVGPCVEAPDGWLPRTAQMRGSWGWDVRCSCGWETRTGGGTERSVRTEIWLHRFATDRAIPLDGSVHSG